VRLSLVSLIVVATLGGGCATGTAHRLPIASNPLRGEASHCEVACRSLIRPARPVACSESFSCNEARAPGPPDDSDYARCLDGCPGATAIDGASCPDPPEEGVVCVKTYKANVGGIVGGTAAALGGAVAVAGIALVVSLPAWFLLILVIH